MIVNQRSVLFGLLLLLVGCSASDDKVRATVEVNLTRIASFDLDFEPAHVMAIDDAGITLFDRFAGELVLVDLAGTEQKRWGRKGNGPGELKLVSSLLKTEDGGLWALDVGRGRGIRYGPGGELVGEVFLPGAPSGVYSNDGTDLGGIWLSGFDLAVSRVSLGGTGDEPRDVLAAIPELSANVEPGVPPFIVGTWTASGTVIMAVPGAYQLVEARQDLSVVSIFGRDLPDDYPTDEDSEHLKRTILETIRLAGAEGQIPPSFVEEQVEARRKVPKPPLLPRATAIDSEGRFWIATSRRSSGQAVLDVFGVDREFLGSVEVSGRPIKIGFSQDKLAVLTERDSGTQAVDLYTVSVVQ